MIYRDFGKTGMRVSAIGMGCEYVWTADEKQIFDLVRAAVDAGINYFDLFAAGNILKNHEEGRLKGLLSESGSLCPRVELMTGAGMPEPANEAARL